MNKNQQAKHAEARAEVLSVASDLEDIQNTLVNLHNAMDGNFPSIRVILGEQIRALEAVIRKILEN